MDYPSNQECSYQIARPGGGPLSLRFNRFDVANDDFIEVFNDYLPILILINFHIKIKGLIHVIITYLKFLNKFLVDLR